MFISDSYLDHGANNVIQSVWIGGKTPAQTQGKLSLAWKHTAPEFAILINSQMFASLVVAGLCTGWTAGTLYAAS